MTRHEGGCHCGALRVEFKTALPLAPRACQCTFCRKHEARSVSDPTGAAVVALDPAVIRYRFGTRSADFLICGQCGVYVGAVQEIDGRHYAVLNLTAFDDPRPELAAEPFRYDGEEPGQRAARRRARWTPARLVDR
jgi:hypothetical protein